MKKEIRAEDIIVIKKRGTHPKGGSKRRKRKNRSQRMGGAMSWRSEPGDGLERS